MRSLILKMLTLLYRVETLGAERIPASGTGVLMVCNHVSYVDALILQMASHRTIRFLSFDAFFSVPVLGSLLRLFRAIPISPHHAKDAIVKSVAALKEGELVCIFPEGQLTRTGHIEEFQKGFELIVRKAQVSVLPVHLDSLWHSIFSYQGGYAFWKWPQRIPFPVKVTFGVLVPFSEVKAEDVRKKIIQLEQKTER